MSNLFGMKPNTYCMLLHLSQLLASFLPVIGLAAPIVLWIINKDKEPLVNRHGKIVMNWLISVIIYYAVSMTLIIVVVFCAMLIPIPIISVAIIDVIVNTIIYVCFTVTLVLMVICVVFPVIGGIRANNGIEWQYPLSIRFFK
ncbi:MAG: DUF4870 domain-containing protein [Planctomycetaceae bacterium]|nr:DUF4870 domain-containing protein [Planctomycetaceae bacterium]